MNRTAEDVLRDFSFRGISVAEWARSHGFTPSLVYQVLRSSNTPARGKSHSIAVQLGMKTGITEQDLDFTRSRNPK
ncbi:DNA-binding protein [Massilia antarctica]|uniref:DNA-binding protein n=1 Tax=Massilia antarctica TaxID=2765360 RepID=UPI0035A6BE35